MFKVCIDPGHGGSDRSNRGPSCYVEADGVLAISKYLKEELESTGQFQAILTRDRDKTLTLTERGRIAARNKVDLFISQHTNAGPKGAGGTEVYYSVDIPGDRELAAKLSAAVAQVLGIQDRGAKTSESTRYPGEDYYTVIDKAQDGGVPHVLLIESAFHSNPDEERLLLQDENLRKIAQAQAKVICEFFGVQYSQQANVYIVQSGDTLWGIAQKFKTTVEEIVKLNSISNPSLIHPGQELIVGSIEVDKVQPAPQPENGDEKVRELQHILNMLHITDTNGKVLVEDGLYGPATTSAVKKFQGIAGIQVDGSAGPQTMGVIKQILAMPVTKRGSKGAVVRYIQFRVGVGIDGIFGPKTEAIVKKFQSANGLVADGIVGSKTWKELIG
ncbi:N-acetylmuramoyl-L-alanine amidase [Fonticella tunisiensis]|uniref:N-acetylmuramoyl-L-alanine amidase n=1 Tax=Fonticella tunisiensis TaxID=1096341 RepID=A0A4R7KWZ5_9CLOT|nr:N-acetylmuramoyl-L-alanine amidase [Fonticella tunisiensis]TDT63436.1 N-acetylmuramoyl-L-alanine amidase [Fonticella tunisiensis]